MGDGTSMAIKNINIYRAYKTSTMNNASLELVLKLMGIAAPLFTIIFGIMRNKMIAVKVGSGIVAIISIVVITGYIVDAPQIYILPGDKIGMALLTAICLLALSVCIWVLSDLKR
jgi:hypothetical protein